MLTRVKLLPNIKLDAKTIAKGRPIDIHIVSFCSKLDSYKNASPGDSLFGGNDDELDDKPRYIPQIIGVTGNGSSVIVNVFNFAPYFLIKCPEKIGDKKWSNNYLDDVEYTIKNLCGNLNKHHVRKVSILNLRSFRGFKKYKKFLYIKVHIDNDKILNRVVNAIKNGVVFDTISKKKVYLELADTKLEAHIKFIHDADIDTGGWINIHHFEESDNPIGKVSYEINVEMRNVKKIVNANHAPMVRLAFDIEVNSHDGHSFPVATILENAIFQISNNFRVEGTKQSAYKVLLTLKECTPIKPSEAIDDHADPILSEGTQVLVYEFAREYDLLDYWISLVISVDPDYIYGFNNFGFDSEYIGDRAFYLDGGRPSDPRDTKARVMDMAKRPGTLCNKLMQMGRTETISPWTSKLLQSAALGSRKMSYNPMPGRVIFDVMHAIGSVKSLDQYTMNFCADTLLGTKKKDVPAPEIFRLYQSGHPDEIKRVGVYCIVDSEIPHDLVDKLNIIWSNAAVASVSCVPQEYIFIRGQSIKIGSYCAKMCRANGIAFDDPKDTSGLYKHEKWYEGAYVMNARPNFYDDPIYVCDFNSLYPSEEISHDLSQDTLVEIGGEYDNLPDVKYTDFDIPVKRLMPNFPELADLKTGKKADEERRLAAEAEDAAEAAELALSDDGIPEGLPEGDPGSNPKERDRDKKIKKATPKELVKLLKKHYKEYGTDFTMLANNKETTAEYPKKPDDEKQMAKFDKDRKKIAEEFPMTTTMRKELAQCFIEPLDDMLPSDLLDKEIPVNFLKIVITTRRIRFASMPEKHKGILPDILTFVLLARKETREKQKYNYARMGRHEKRMAGEFNHAAAINKAIDGLKANKKWTAGFVSEMVHNLEEELNRDYASYTKEQYKEEINLWKKENENYENLQNAFKVTANSFYGQCGSNFSMIYCLEVAAATTTAGQQDIKLAADVVEKLFASDVVVYGDTDSIFVQCRLGHIREKWKNYELTEEEAATINEFFAKRELLAKKKKIEKSGGVFLITDELIKEKIEEFTADQIKQFPKKYIQMKCDEELVLTAMDHAKKSAEAINKAINRPPMNIEFEKVIYPYIQFTPKRYKGLYHTNEADPLACDIKTMGLVDKKRDNCKYTQNCFKELTEGLLSLMPKKKIKQMFIRQVQDLLDGSVEVKDLVITKKIGQAYKATLPAHVICANRLKERMYAKQYHVNDRIPYIITLTEDLTVARPMSKAPKLSDMVEEVNYAIEHELPINYLYYLSNICIAPLLDTIALIEPDPIGLLRKVLEEYDIPKWFRINWHTVKYAL
jgi:DNA polymerase elongation subunit (family B)